MLWSNWPPKAGLMFRHHLGEWNVHLALCKHQYCVLHVIVPLDVKAAFKQVFLDWQREYMFREPDASERSR